MDFQALATLVLLVTVAILIVEVQRMKRMHAPRAEQRASTISHAMGWRLKDVGWTYWDAERELNRWKDAK